MIDVPGSPPIAVKRVPTSRRAMLRRIGMNTYIALVGAYGLNTTLYLILRAIVGERWGIIGLFNSFFHLLILPAVILLPISLILRRRWLVIELAAPFFFFISTYSGQFLPRSMNVPTAAPRLVVLTYNLLGKNQKTDEVLQIIAESKADIVTLQELSFWMSDAFNEKLASLYPYRSLYPQNDFSGQGVLSRYPITDEEYWKSGQGFMKVVLDRDGTAITVFNAHPAVPNFGIRGFNTLLRSEGIDDLLKRASSETNPTLVVGDFNMTDLTDDYIEVTDHFQDTFKETGWGLGFSYPMLGISNPQLSFLPPLARLDYIFHDTHFQSIEMRVGSDSGGSDHFPVRAELALIGEDYQ